jgi:putative ABC transport system ATP-binding protein
MAHLLEDVARCQLAFKVNSGLHYSVEKADTTAESYVYARRKHFSVLIRQMGWNVIVNATVTAGLLAVGGWLVMHGKLTLGQLVAAELMTLLLLSATNKVAENMEEWYDLLTGLDKLGALTDLPNERASGVGYITQESGGLHLGLHHVGFRYAGQPGLVFQQLNMECPAGSRTAIVGPSGAGKTTLCDIILGLLKPSQGVVQLNRQHLEDISLDEYRRHAAMVESPNSIFNGTIRDNILMGRSWIDEPALQKALMLSGLDAVLEQLPDGLNMLLQSEGGNLSAGNRQLLLLARAVAGDPELLVLDEAFHAIDRPMRLRILARVFDAAHPWTIVVVTHDADVLSFCDHAYLLADGMIAAQGAPAQLYRERHALFCSLFPHFRQYPEAPSL